jgi:hypothetical protein
MQRRKEQLLQLLADNDGDYEEKIANLDDKHANTNLQGLAMRYRNKYFK